MNNFIAQGHFSLSTPRCRYKTGNNQESSWNVIALFPHVPELCACKLRLIILIYGVFVFGACNQGVPTFLELEIVRLTLFLHTLPPPELRTLGGNFLIKLNSTQFESQIHIPV